MKLNQQTYLHNKQTQLILKAKKPLFVKIQMIYNNAVDERVLTYYEDEDILKENSGFPNYNEALLTTKIGNLNRLATYQEFQRLMKHSLIDPDEITKLMIKNKSIEIADRITKIEVERTLKNLDYIENTLEDVEFKINTYKELTKKLPKKVNRYDILKRASEKGEYWDGRKVRDIGKLQEDLHRYSQNKQKYEEAIMENEQASREGMNPLKSKKIWEWTPNERTRHHNMDGQEVDLYDKFIVENEVNGDVDYLLFPRDIENAGNGCSNTCNCLCTYKTV